MEGPLPGDERSGLRTGMAERSAPTSPRSREGLWCQRRTLHFPREAGHEGHGCGLRGGAWHLSARRLFLFSVFLLLAATGAAKVWSALGAARILALPDPVIGLPRRDLLWGAGAAELCVGVVVLAAPKGRLTLPLVHVLAVSFALYRVGAWALAVGEPCPCLGTTYELLPLPEGWVNALMLCAALYLLAGSSWFLYTSGRKIPRGATASEPGVGDPATT